MTSDPESTHGDEPGLLPEFLLAEAFAPGQDVGGLGSSISAGMRLGTYRIRALIGSGGMGTVYEAEQHNPRRSVALKLLRPGLATRSMVHRFQREVRLLASLQHPGIAQVFEAGSLRSGSSTMPLHFFAMELVRGLPLDEHAQRAGLDLRERLELVARACDAVQHAHQRGIIHRDLKPGNILVVESDHGGDAIGQPKVLDFGVARALAGEDGEPSHQTLAGQIVGTLGYMSPEQVLGDARSQDVRSDVYALGALLYRLLTGRMPIDVSGCSVVEAGRRVRELEPEPPSSLAPSVPPEVETMVAKALAKDREVRYQSAADLAADLRRHLRGEPIEARAHSALYLLRKAIGRNRPLFAAASVVLLLLVAFAAVSSWQARRNRTLASQESAARGQLAETASLLEQELARSTLERGYLFSSAGNVLGAEDLLWREFFRNPASAETHWALRDLYLRHPCLATRQVSDHIVWVILALPDGERVASVDEGGVVRVHGLDPLSSRALEPRQASGPQSLALDGSGRWLLHFGPDGRVDRFDSTTLEFQHSIQVREAGANGWEGAAFDLSPGGAALVVGLTDGSLRELDLSTGEPLASDQWHEAGVVWARFSPDGASLASGDAEGRLVVRPRVGAAPRLDLPTGHGGISRIEFSADGRRIFTGGMDRRVRVWDRESGALVATWTAPNGTVRQVADEPERGRVLVSGWWSLDAWDPEDSERAVLLPVSCDSFVRLPERGLFLSSGRGQVRVWDQSAVDGLTLVDAIEDRIVASFLAGGRRVAVGAVDGRLRIFEGGGGRPVHELESHTARVHSLAGTPDGRLLLSGSADGTLCITDLERGELVERIEPSLTVSACGIDVSPDGERFLHVRDLQTVLVRDMRTRAVLRSLPAYGLEVTGVRFLPDGERVATVVRERSVRIFDAEGELELELASPDPLWAIDIASDGAWLAGTTWPGDVIVWDLGTGAVAQRLRGHAATPWDVAFRPGDSAVLASASGDGTVRVWDRESGRCLLVVDGFEGSEALSVDFDATGERLLIASSNGAVRAVDLRASERCIAGNLDYQLERLRSELGPALDEAAVRAALPGSGRVVR